MVRYIELDKDSLLEIGLLSASVHSVLSKLSLSPPATEEQKEILTKALELTKDIRDGKISKPDRNEHFALPRPSAIKARRFAIQAIIGIASSSRNGGGPPTNLDEIMQNYLELFNGINETGSWTPDKNETVVQARQFFGRLNQIALDIMNGLVDEESPAAEEPAHQFA